MATVAVMAWYPISDSVAGQEDPPGRAGTRLSTTQVDLIRFHHGRPDVDPGVAYFPGAVDALRAAVAWQQDDSTGSTAIAVTVTELEDPDDSDDPAVVLTRRLAEAGEPRTITATDIVRLLIPTPDVGTWIDEMRVRPRGMSTVSAHQLQWRSPADREPITVVVAEDAAIIRAGVISLLRADEMDVVGEADDFPSLLATVRSRRPRLLITDIRMPPGQGDEGLRAAGILRTEQPELAVLVLSQHVQATAAADLLAGQTSGIGYLLKERVTALDDFLSAARTVAGGGTVIDPLITQELLNRQRSVDQFQALGDREKDVLDLMAQGLSNSAIAERLTLSPRTVESHVRSIMTKLDLWDDPGGNRRVQAVVRWLSQH